MNKFRPFCDVLFPLVIVEEGPTLILETTVGKLSFRNVIFAIESPALRFNYGITDVNYTVCGPEPQIKNSATSLATCIEQHFAKIIVLQKKKRTTMVACNWSPKHKTCFQHGLMLGKYIHVL